MSLTPLAFTGVSQFSADFQTILKRAVSIASLPVQALQNQQQDVLSQKVLVSNLRTSVATLAAAVSTLGETAGQKALAASSSNPAKVTATAVNAPAPAVYTLTEISSVARAAAETSLTGFATPTATPVSATGTMRLTVGSRQYTLHLSTANHLTGLRDAINRLGAGVTAAVLTTGAGATPYYLSVTANQPGATTLTLEDDPGGAAVHVLTNLNQGANTIFRLNGVAVEKPTTQINDVVPGVTFSIQGTTSGAESVTVTVASDRERLATALDSFVRNYNAVREQVNAQVGSGAGLLSGDFLVREVQTQLRALASFAGTGGGASIRGLASLGVEFNQNGEASFNRTVLDGLSGQGLADAFAFLGSATTGIGRLAASLTAISDPSRGLAKIQIEKYDETDRRLGKQIAQMTERIAQMQSSLNAKLQRADSLLASLSAQQNLLDASIKALQFSLYGRQRD